jgi:hypothetical protein
VTLAYLTNAEGSVIIAVVFSTIAATVISVRLHLRARQRDSREEAGLSLLERIEAMTNEEFDTWRAEAKGRPEATTKRRQAGQRNQRDQHDAHG